MLCQCFHTRIVERISCPPLAIGRFKFELVSVTHELDSIRIQFSFKPIPVVSSLGIIRFVIDSPYYITGRKHHEELASPFFLFFSAMAAGLLVQPFNGFFVMPDADLRRERLHAIPLRAKGEKRGCRARPLAKPCCFPPANRSPRTVFLIGKAQPPYFRHVNIINQQEMVFWSGWVSVPPFPYQHLEHRRRSCSVLSASSGKRKTPDFVGDRASYPAPMCPSRKRKTPDFVGNREFTAMGFSSTWRPLLFDD